MAETDAFQEISKGRVSGSLPVVIFGRNPDIDPQSDPEDIISQGGDYEGFLATTAEVLNLVSTDDADAPAGSGAIDVLIFGLDINHNEISERRTLNGQTPVQTVNAYLRVNEMFVDNVGAGERNTGVISAVQNTADHKMSEISIGAGIAHQAIFTVKNKKAFIPKHLNVYLNDAAGTTALMTIEARKEPGKSWRQFFISGLSQGGGGTNLKIDITRVFPPKCDLKIRIIEVSSNDCDVSARLTGTLDDFSSIRLPVINL